MYDPQSLNRYSYARNNPINASDPTGHKCVGEVDECVNEKGKPINAAGGLTPTKKDKESPEDILKKHSDKTWNELTPEQQEILINEYQCSIECWNENRSGGSENADALHDPLFYAETLLVGGGIIRSGVTLWQIVSASLPVLTAAGADGDPTNEYEAVSQIAQQVAENTGGVLQEAQGAGWRVTLPGAAGGNNIVTRIMMEGGIRLEPYYRVAVQNVGAVTSSGAFSSDPALTHHVIDLANPAQVVTTITNLIQGLMH